MKHFAQKPQIGETQDFAAPATRHNIPELVDAYVERAEAIEDLIDQLSRAVGSLKSGTSLMGQFGGQLFRNEPDVDTKTAHHVLLCSAWKHVYARLRIKEMATAKDRSQIEVKMQNPPPFTLTDILDLFGNYVINPRHHILRGLAECFCDLDPAYKSHSNVRIGVKGLPKRIIISHVGGWNGWGKEKLRDTLNALRVYRGEARFEHVEFSNLMDEAKREGEAAFNGGTVRRFMNGNAHLIFDAPALLDINRALAEFYGEVLPDAPNEAEVKRPSTEVTRDLQFYWTPGAAIDEVLRRLDLQSGDKIVEPSCGDGRILDVLAKWHKGDGPYDRRLPLVCTGIEYDASRAATSRAKGHHVMTANFLQVQPEPIFDKVIMNPPFHGKTYVKHLKHALKFSREGGVLVCIMPATAHYDHKTTMGQWFDLPVGSFSEAGTNVPTGFCVVYK